MRRLLSDGQRGTTHRVTDASLHQTMLEAYPDALIEGSVGSWSATVDGVVVAEAWMHKRSGWWLRLIKREERPESRSRTLPPK